MEAKLIRVLHNYAFLEDPSRLIRATRFAARFHWELEERTKARYDAAKENNYIEYISRKSIGYEIAQIAFEENPLQVMQALEKEGWLKVLHPQWSTAKADQNEMSQWMKTRQQLQDLGFTIDAAPLAIYFLTKRMADKDIAEIQRLIPHQGVCRCLAGSRRKRQGTGEETEQQGSVDSLARLEGTRFG